MKAKVSVMHFVFFVSNDLYLEFQKLIPMPTSKDLRRVASLTAQVLPPLLSENYSLAEGSG